MKDSLGSGQEKVNHPRRYLFRQLEKALLKCNGTSL